MCLMAERQSLNEIDRRVLAAARRFAVNDRFTVTRGQLGAASGYAERTISRSLARLRDAGILRVERLSRPTAYAIDAAALPPEVGE